MVGPGAARHPAGGGGGARPQVEQGPGAGAGGGHRPLGGAAVVRVPRGPGPGDDAGATTGGAGPSRRAVTRGLRLALKVTAAVLGLVVVYLAVTFVQVYAASRHDEARRAQAIVVFGAARCKGRPPPAL